MSGKTFVEKIRLKAGQRLFVSGTPDGLVPTFSALPSGSMTSRTEEADIALVFVRDRAELEENVPPLSSELREGSILWVAYPKQSSKVPTDLNRDKIWEWARNKGMDAVANVAVDEVWSALRLKRTR